ncbi:PepSY-associated TM helix domain-containing protein [Corallococcus sp. RDP092CA]|uniref:PepSY-associated TM helix domain-containing protein n=1 Tax=Corallococcus sp. RDP092CA TaxID=3109369 RepID=UPI0035B169EC
MRSAIIRLYKVVHTWTGIVAGLGLFICFYAGGFTVFKDALARWATPPGERAPAPLSSAELHALVKTTLAEHPKAAEDFTLVLADAPEWGPSPMSWRRNEGGEGHDVLEERRFYATLRADGSSVVAEGHPTKVGEFIDVLHRVVGLPFDTELGRLVTGILSLLYALALVSGLVIVLPSLVRDFFALRLGKGLKRLWMDVHNVVGIASLPFHLLIAITACVFGLHDGIYFVQDKLIHGGTLRAALGPPTGGARTAPAPEPATMLPPAELLSLARTVAPSFEPHALQYVRVASPRALVRVWGHDPAALSPRSLGGFLALDPYSGKVLSTDFLPGRLTGPSTLIASFFALHFGSFGGLPVKWIYFLLALSGAWLFYSGNVLWVETRRKKARVPGQAPLQRRDVRWMAATTVGVCLGCVSGISFTLVLAKWLQGHVSDLRVFHQCGYYAVFFASIVYAWVRGPARAAIELLWGAALFTLAIPLTTLVGWLAPVLGPWATWDALGVDLTALAGAFCFAWMARATARRAHAGPEDSVWSLGASPASTGLETDIPEGEVA